MSLNKNHALGTALTLSVLVLGPAACSSVPNGASDATVAESVPRAPLDIPPLLNGLPEPESDRTDLANGSRDNDGGQASTIPESGQQSREGEQQQLPQPKLATAPERRDADLGAGPEASTQNCDSSSNKLNQRCFLTEPPVEYNTLADPSDEPELTAADDGQQVEPGDGQQATPNEEAPAIPAAEEIEL